MKKIELFVRTVTVKRAKHDKVSEKYNFSRAIGSVKTLSRSFKPDKLFNSNRTLTVGPLFSGKTHLMLRILTRIPNTVIYSITKSPAEQNFKSEIKNKENGEEIRPLNDYEKIIIIFDEILGTSNSKFKDQFFTRGRHHTLDIYYLSQTSFDLPKTTIRNNSNKIYLFSRSLNNIGNKYI